MHREEALLQAANLCAVHINKGVGFTNESVVGRMAEEHLDLKYTARKLIGSEKASKKMIGLEQLCQQ